ncbi:MAG: hypothetical protein ACM3NQ_22370, partial [Bacteroidales bacterium]
MQRRPTAPVLDVHARDSMGPVTGAASYVALAGAMVSGNGRFTYLAIALALAAFGGLILLAHETPASRAPEDPERGGFARTAERRWEVALGVSLLLCLALGLTTKPGEFVGAPAYRVVLAVVSLA